MITKFFLDSKFHEFILYFQKTFFENKNDETLNNKISILQGFVDFVGI